MSVELFGTDTLGDFLQSAVEKMADGDSDTVTFTAEIGKQSITFRLQVVAVGGFDANGDPQ